MPDRDFRRRVGARIRRERERRELSQAELAERLELDRGQISRWERGVGLPSWRNLWRLAETLGVEPEAFFSNNDDVRWLAPH